MELIVVKNAALPLLLSIGGNYNLFAKKKIVKLKLLIMKNNFRQIDHKQFVLFFFRLITKMAVADATDNQWVNCFQEQGEAILGTR